MFLVSISLVLGQYLVVFFVTVICTDVFCIFFKQLNSCKYFEGMLYQ